MIDSLPALLAEYDATEDNGQDDFNEGEHAQAIQDLAEGVRAFLGMLGLARR